MTPLLSIAYLAPVEYYVQLYQSPQVLIEQQDNYVKQTYRNRCVIASANGLQTLSIPIIKPETPKILTRDIRIAGHGDWQHLHWNAIVSAYRSSPFFEYYEADFRPFYEKQPQFLFDFDEQLRELVCSLVDISPNVIYSSEYIKTVSGDTLDLREAIHPKKPAVLNAFKPYYQVFESRFGFQSNLSILDLLFNMGTESVLVLQNHSSCCCPVYTPI
ncbi:MAG: WbqC family protein [Candidatus Symbiothrix sp.]|jgi:hypothetical protein|nr:WbqC family protein [Candidatus Symbiothrix sp.]